MSENANDREIILGVDTHLDQHVAVLIDVVGRVIGSRSVATLPAGYEDLIQWAK